jgi:hypothetical protein
MRTLAEFAGLMIMVIIITFVMINIFMGCESWMEPNCITPRELFNIIF